ncbi:hypothetical protein NFC73_11535 [Pseudarthrobacter sp. RMG13]|uniref:Uncharacterized protein n=1 Tax=Pseudarthrobacter humi TaxID=2952523 RepID=A0ABT1LPH0_9MICC|nr:hypothetical protein [Pseudarthrobacter humi]MCP9000354.1 hypothetical protein [Pseudarthrobacter humi]
MDGETIRLIVVALGAIIAGLSGSLIAGAYNSQNTLATIEAARLAAETELEAGREMEHDRWLRDRKIDAYTALINQFRELDQMVREHHSGIYLKGTFDIVQASRNINTLEVRLLAPVNVSAAVADVILAMQERFDIFIEDAQKEAPDSSAFDTATEKLVQKMDRLERLISEDLGVPGKES